MAGPIVPMTRRRFLAAGGAAAAGAVLLGACGGDDDEPAAAGSSTTAPSDSKFILVQYFGGHQFAAGLPLRVPVGLGDEDGLLLVEDTPARVGFRLLDQGGDELAPAVEVASHSAGLPRAYFPVEVGPLEAGFYSLRADVDGAPEVAFQVEAPDQLSVPLEGGPMPSLDTPTVADPRGVDPVCTADPPCPFHAVSLAEALGSGRPTAVLVSTPAFCKVAICGPVLDVLQTVMPDHEGVTPIHVEVYSDPFHTDDPRPLSPAMTALGLDFEPVLFAVGTDGKVARRLDTIFDTAEVGEVLAALS